MTTRAHWVRVAAVLRARPSFAEQTLHCIYQRAEVAREIIRAHPPGSPAEIEGFITFVATKGKTGFVSPGYLDHLASHYLPASDRRSVDVA